MSILKYGTTKDEDLSVGMRVQVINEEYSYNGCTGEIYEKTIIDGTNGRKHLIWEVRYDEPQGSVEEGGWLAHSLKIVSKKYKFKDTSAEPNALMKWLTA